MRKPRHTFAWRGFLPKEVLHVHTSYAIAAVVAVGAGILGALSSSSSPP